MKKEYVYPWFGVLFFLLANIAYADVSISEIMYDPDGSDTNREWIEVYNDGSTSVDLSAWKFVEAETNHGLTSHSGGTTLSAGEFGIIALDAGTFVGEYSVSGPVFDASFSLGNTNGETLSLKDAGGTIVYTVTYDPTLGATDDGNSLQKYSGSWVPADPTPGNTNTNSDGSGSSDDTGGGTGGDPDDGNSGGETTTSQSVVEQQKVEIYDEWQLTLFADSYGIVGSPAVFTTDVKNLFGTNIRHGWYVWNMGDGTQYVGEEYGEVTHTYEYPGDYVITLEYWRSGASEKEVSVRHTFSVKATAMQIKGIVKPDGSLDVELKNTSSNEVDLSLWALMTAKYGFTIPSGTIVLGNKTITFPARVTSFVASDISTLSLRAPNGVPVATSTPAPVVTTSSRSYTSGSSSSSSSSRESTASTVYADDGESSLGADASRAGIDVGKNMWWMLSLGLIILGIGSTVYMRRERQEKGTDAFEVKIIGE